MFAFEFYIYWFSDKKRELTLFYREKKTVVTMKG
jgi:hypothetical protein